MKNNIVGWFEIPVIDLKRAIRFYESILDIKLFPAHIAGHDMATFPWIEDGLGSSGALIVQGEHFKPGYDGVMIYLSSPSGNVANELGKVVAAGGKVILNKELITEEVGYWGLFTDTEGNKIGIHSRK
jgi:predicted enzyme related to lactoylglutathione lyase